MKAIFPILILLLVRILPDADLRTQPVSHQISGVEAEKRASEEERLLHLILPPDPDSSSTPDRDSHEQPTRPLRKRIETGFIAWGTDGGTLYYSWNERDWRRVGTIEDTIYYLFPLNDTSVGMWNGRKYFAYTLGADSAVRIIPDGPLEEFLKYPIRTITYVGAGQTSGWISPIVGHPAFNRGIRFDVQDGMVVPSGELRASYEGEVPALPVDELSNALRALSRDVDSLPDLKDFNITPEDIRLFHRKVDETERYPHDRHIPGDSGKFDREFYHRIPDLLDTLSPEVFDAILRAYPRYHVSHPLSYAVLIINDNNDSIGMGGLYRIMFQPWGMPWRVEAGREVFYTRSIDFARFIGRLLSDSIVEKPMFSNVELLMRIGDYLYYGM